MHLTFLIQTDHSLWKDTSKFLSLKYQTLTWYTISRSTRVVLNPAILSESFAKNLEIYQAELILVVLSTISSRSSKGVGGFTEFHCLESRGHVIPYYWACLVTVTLAIHHDGREQRASSSCQVHTVASMYEQCSPNAFSLVESLR